METLPEDFRKLLENVPTCSVEQLQELYGTAYSAYKRSNYAESSDLFTYLVLREPLNPTLWKGLASSRQMEAKYKEALHAWALVCLLSEEEKSQAHFHAAECLVGLNEKEEALTALEKSLEGTNKKSELARLIGLLKEEMAHA